MDRICRHSSSLLSYKSISHRIRPQSLPSPCVFVHGISIFLGHYSHSYEETNGQTRWFTRSLGLIKPTYWRESGSYVTSIRCSSAFRVGIANSNVLLTADRFSPRIDSTGTYLRLTTVYISTRNIAPSKTRGKSRYGTDTVWVSNNSGMFLRIRNG